MCFSLVDKCRTRLSSTNFDWHRFFKISLGLILILDVVGQILMQVYTDQSNNQTLRWIGFGCVTMSMMVGFFTLYRNRAWSAILFIFIRLTALTIFVYDYQLWTSFVHGSFAAIESILALFYSLHVKQNEVHLRLLSSPSIDQSQHLSF